MNTCYPNFLSNVFICYTKVTFCQCHVIASFTHLNKHFYLSVEVVMQVALLVLRTQHVHDFAVFWSARRAFRLAVGVTFKAVLVEGMAAQEVN